MLRLLAGILLVYLIVLVGTLARNNVKKYNFIGKADRMQNTISISGEGKETGAPNVAMTDIGFVTESKDVATAQKENTEKMNKLIAEVKKLGVADADIQTSNYSVYPRYDYTDGKSLLSGYTVNQSVTLKIRDLTKISSVLAKVGEVGVNQVSSLNFIIDDQENLRASARDKALKNAKEKADALAKSLGVRIVKVISYNEYTPSDVYPMKAYGMAEGMGGGASAPSPDIQTGSMEIKVSVNVIYEIE
ncbi:MAG: SIMPL domain-containing protein [Candidatus Magasanikbacteria bacterium]|nr:SIMPL domain-containing protein [Candidatus Magasanikbacteria bacterium]